MDGAYFTAALLGLASRASSPTQICGLIGEQVLNVEALSDHVGHFAAVADHPSHQTPDGPSSCRLAIRLAVEILVGASQAASSLRAL
jgi:hypothetical protein